MFGEQLLAGIGFEVSKALAGFRQHEIAFAQLGRSQQLRGFTEVKYLVGFELRPPARTGKSACPLYGGPRQRLDQTGKDVGRDMVEDHADAGAGNAFDGRGPDRRALRHAGIEAVDELPERRVKTVARMRQSTLISAATRPGLDEDTRMRSHEGGKRFVHQQKLRMHDQWPGKPDALAHAA